MDLFINILNSFESGVSKNSILNSDKLIVNISEDLKIEVSKKSNSISYIITKGENDGYFEYNNIVDITIYDYTNMDNGMLAGEIYLSARNVYDMIDFYISQEADMATISGDVIIKRQNCSSELYKNLLLNYLRRWDKFSDSDIRESVEKLMPFVCLNINQLLDNVDKNKDKYIKLLENEKYMLTDTYYKNMSQIDERINSFVKVKK